MDLQEKEKGKHEQGIKELFIKNPNNESTK